MRKYWIWLWWAVEHETNTPLAYVFGIREYQYLEELIELLNLFSIGTVCPNNHFDYESRIIDKFLVSGKRTYKKYIFINK